MTESLFTSQVPSGGFNDGSPGITTSTTLKFAVAGTITAIRWYVVAPLTGGTWTGCVWEVTNTDAASAGTGTLLNAGGDVAGSTPTGDAWNTITLATPISVVANKLYRVGMHNGSNYCVLNNAFNGADIVNGNISAFRNGSDPLGNGWAIRQGAYVISGTATAYPTEVGSAAAYFVDVVFTATGGSTLNGAAAQTVTLAGTATAAGVRSGAAAQTITLAGTAAAAGIRSVDGAQTVSFTGAVAAAGVRPVDAAQTPTLAGTATAAGVRSGAAAQTITLAGTASAAVVASGLNATAAQTVSLAGTASGTVIHNAQATQAIGFAGTAVPEPNPEPVVEEGAWEGLLAPVNVARAAHRLALQRRANPIDCPVHHWPLHPAPGGGWHCMFGGHVVTHGE